MLLADSVEAAQVSQNETWLDRDANAIFNQLNRGNAGFGSAPATAEPCCLPQLLQMGGTRQLILETSSETSANTMQSDYTLAVTRFLKAHLV